jgi:hypothetical protein
MSGNTQGRIEAWRRLAVQFAKTNVFVLQCDSAKVEKEVVNRGG